MRWPLWSVLVGLLIASLIRTPAMATALATGLVTAGIGARSRARPTGPRRVRLTRWERTALRGIERRSAAEDPGFVARLRGR